MEKNLLLDVNICRARNAHILTNFIIIAIQLGTVLIVNIVLISLRRVVAQGVVAVHFERLNVGEGEMEGLRRVTRLYVSVSRDLGQA